MENTNEQTGFENDKKTRMENVFHSEKNMDAKMENVFEMESSTLQEELPVIFSGNLRGVNFQFSHDFCRRRYSFDARRRHRPRFGE